MNFFRLRIINTLLLFLVGIVLGFILKDKFYPAARPSPDTSYRPAAPARLENLPAARPDSEEPTDEPYTVPEPENGNSAPPPAPEMPRPSAPRPDPARAEPEALVIEPGVAGGESRDARRQAVTGVENDFFRNAAAFEGRELEMQLQMITAKKSQRGWRVNMVYTGPDKKIDYLYVEDTELLGEKPDLRIGYVYKIRFLCAKGRTDSGNTLLKISATGEKAPWATGLSAVE